MEPDPRFQHRSLSRRYERFGIGPPSCAGAFRQSEDPAGQIEHGQPRDTDQAKRHGDHPDDGVALAPSCGCLGPSLGFLLLRHEIEDGGQILSAGCRRSLQRTPLFGFL